jgi:hypothetical protein
MQTLREDTRANKPRTIKIKPDKPRAQTIILRELFMNGGVTGREIGENWWLVGSSG